MVRQGSPTSCDSDGLADPGYVIPASAGRVRDMPEGLRPREEMERRGAENVSDAVLLAVLLRTGAAGLNVVDLAQGLMRRYGSLSELAAAGVDQLAADVRGLGPVKAQILKAALEIGRRLSAEELPRRYSIRTPEDVARLLVDEARVLDTEHFWVLHLNAKNQLRARPLCVTRGLLDASLVHPREVFRSAISGATAAVVLAHNHPSGDPQPSAEDIRITRQMVEAGRIIDIKVLDHVVIGRPGGGRDQAFVSLREAGLVSFD